LAACRNGEAIVENAWNNQDRFEFSFWDALIVAAAKSASCRFLLTEDLEADQELDGLLVINPFLFEPLIIKRSSVNTDG
jgi:predicted nucleic acid-binding protein